MHFEAPENISTGIQYRGIDKFDKTKLLLNFSNYMGIMAGIIT